MRKPEDAEIRINNKESRGIIFKDNAILLIFRRKKGEEYYVFPGGHMRIGETAVETAIREIKEETSTDVKNLKPAFEINSFLKKEKYNYYFVGEWKSGEPKLSGEESRESNKANYYEPRWVDINDIEKLTLYPLMAKDWIKNYLNK